MQYRNFALVVLAVALVSCGDGSTPTVTTTTTSVRPVMTDVIDESASSLRSNFYITLLGRSQAEGQLEAIVDWTFQDSAIFTYVADGDCTGDQFANADCPGGPTCECEFLAISEETQPKPRVMTLSDFSPRQFTVIIWNAGTRDESVSWQILLRTGGTFLRTSESGLAAGPALEREPSPR